MAFNPAYRVINQQALGRLEAAIAEFRANVEIQPAAISVDVEFISDSDVVSIKPRDAETINGLYLIRRAQPVESPITAYISEAAPDFARVIIGDRGYRVHFRRDTASISAKIAKKDISFY